jgi:uncharacterized protein YciI
VSDLERATVAELLARMTSKELFLIESAPLASFEALEPFLRDHLLYIIGLEKAGVLFASGPLTNRDNAMTGAGITIVRADSFEDAEQIAQGDPFVHAGLRQPTVHKWTMNEGRITISLDLSDGTATIA